MNAQAEIEDGRLTISPWRRSSADEAEELKARLYGLLPRIRFTDLLVEVSAWARFADRFVQARSGMARATKRVNGRVSRRRHQPRSGPHGGKLAKADARPATLDRRMAYSRRSLCRRTHRDRRSPPSAQSFMGPRRHLVVRRTVLPCRRTRRGTRQPQCPLRQRTGCTVLHSYLGLLRPFHSKVIAPTRARSRESSTGCSTMKAGSRFANMRPTLPVLSIMSSAAHVSHELV